MPPRGQLRRRRNAITRHGPPAGDDGGQEESVKDKLVKLYGTPGVAGAFRGIKGLQNIAEKNNLGKLSTEKARDILQDINSYTLHGRVVKGAANLNERIVSSWPYDLWEADLMEPPKVPQEGRRQCFLLVVIDAYTKYLMVKVLPNKTGKVVGDALREMITKYVPPHTRLNHLRTDAGKEFYNAYCKKVYKEMGVNHYRAQKEPGAAIVERVIRTLQESLSKYITHNPGLTVQDLTESVQGMVDGYNHSVHSMNKSTPASMQEHAYARGSKSGVEILQEVGQGGEGTVADSPEDVSKEKEGDKRLMLAGVFQSTTLGRNKKPNPWDPVNGPPVDNPLAPDKPVRLLRRDNIFRKGSQQKSFTDEVFRVTKASKNNPNAYYLKDDKGEPIIGKVYRRQLQALTSAPETWEVAVYNERTVRGGKKEYLVGWVGHPHLPLEWIPAERTQ